MELSVIARMKSAFSEKYGIPRQSGLVSNLRSTIIFEPPYRVLEALRGIEGFSHLWIIWGFSENLRDSWSPTVRPPRLGGNLRMGVFATRSSFRPNAIAISSVKLDGLETTEQFGTVIHVLGADLMDGTPIYDIKPYLAFTDAHPEATNGFAEGVKSHRLEVEIPEAYGAMLDDSLLASLREVLAQDPRPAYQHDPERVYGFSFSGFEVRFCVDENRLKVLEIR